MLIGLASKNAILIVEFANQARQAGLGLIPAAINAAEQRFRPIIMTAISSLVGFFPLLIATGAGSASRWSVGYTVFGGLLVATVLSLLVVPVLYVILKGTSEWIFADKRPGPPYPAAAHELWQWSQTSRSCRRGLGPYANRVPRSAIPLIAMPCFRSLRPNVLNASRWWRLFQGQQKSMAEAGATHPAKA